MPIPSIRISTGLPSNHLLSPTISPFRCSGRCLCLGLMTRRRRMETKHRKDHGGRRDHGAPPAAILSSRSFLRRCGKCNRSKTKCNRSKTKRNRSKTKCLNPFPERTKISEKKISCLNADINRFEGYLQKCTAPRMLSDKNCSIPLKLKFLNSCKFDKYSTHKIQADDGNPLKVAICDHNNEIIVYEPFSSMRLKVVTIHSDFDNDDHGGQWTEEFFHSKIVTGRPGKERLLSGELYIMLQAGVVYLNSAKFQDNSSFVASKMFKLGVMAADKRISQRIQEGITEFFAVKDARGYSSKKNLLPSPHDAVHKLCRIAPNGDRRKILEEKGISTVGDFLCFYRKSPEDLRKA
ncbi:hypothetical protein BS78_09G064100 [Paspalum vaginatum]|nr:hypothetical protein BS78_09G064100 [Paspalum vaginatum]